MPDDNPMGGASWGQIVHGEHRLSTLEQNMAAVKEAVKEQADSLRDHVHDCTAYHRTTADKISHLNTSLARYSILVVAANIVGASVMFTLILWVLHVRFGM